MKERPILFSGPMVRAILDGRKTQTRRMVKPQPIPDRHHPTTRLEWNPGKLHYTECNLSWRPISNAFADYISNGHCPYGQPGDRLWVRETHRFDGISQRIGVREKRIDALSYRADMEGDQSCDDCAWRPSIYMPRWASRLTLEVTGVRIERLQDISEADAREEGIRRGKRATSSHSTIDTWWDYLRNEPGYSCARSSYSSLWESINGPGSWDANPYVWVVEFRRIQPEQP